jgi:N-acetyl-anhydromuramyl-L-alanine amidase AmpD
MFMPRQSARLLPLPAALRPMRAALVAERYPGIGALWAGSTLRRSADPVFGVEALVVHTAAQTGTAEAVALMQQGRASWHWIVPAIGEAQHGSFLWAVAPEPRAARHLPNRLSDPRVAQGRGQLNHATLGVLIAASPEAPGMPASDWQISALAGLIRHVWARYPNLNTVVCRSEIDPDCPPSGLDWAALREAVALRPVEDLPPLVVAATPLALLEPAGRAEPALRAD